MREKDKTSQAMKTVVVFDSRTDKTTRIDRNGISSTLETSLAVTSQGLVRKPKPSTGSRFSTKVALQRTDFCFDDFRISAASPCAQYVDCFVREPCIADFRSGRRRVGERPHTARDVKTTARAPIENVTGREHCERGGPSSQGHRGSVGERDARQLKNETDRPVNRYEA